jgi:hypothetical protein
MSARGRELSSLLRIPVIEVDLASKNTGLVSASELSAMANLWRTYRCAAVKLRQLWCAPDVSSGSTTAYRTTREQWLPSIPNLVPSACALEAGSQREFRTWLPPLTERLASETCSELNYSGPSVVQMIWMLTIAFN